MEKQPLHFNTRSALLLHVANICSWSNTDSVSNTVGGPVALNVLLDQAQLNTYQRTRNHLEGTVTHISPYIRHGVIAAENVRLWALAQYPGKDIEKFLQELTWRTFWQAHYEKLGERIWDDIEPYKTGWQACDYEDKLPVDISEGTTGVAVIDHFARTLIQTGYLHNHARMYLSSYIVHWRRVKWQAGAQWFLTHLLDGDPASNNLSWQWVASTFSHKPYIFNLNNVQKYASKDMITDSQHNQVLDDSYPNLEKKLFPNLS